MEQKLALGIDIGGTNVKLAIVRSDGRVLVDRSIPTAPERGPEAFSRTVGAEARAMADEASVAWDSVVGAGVGMAGFLDVERGWVEEAVNLHWRDVPLADLLQSSLDKPVRVDNDANVAALGEVWLGAGQNAHTALCVTLGTGVGGGIVIGGRIHRGASTMAGEIGHIMVKNDGELCNCGHRGCLETLASATALVRHAVAAGVKSPDGGELTAKEVFALAAEGHPAARAVVDDMIHWLAVGLAVVANILNPDVIVVAGGLVNAGDQLMEPLRAAFQREALARVARACRLVPAKLGDQAGVLGAARLVLQDIESL